MKLVINLKDATYLYNEDPITLTIPLDKQKPEENTESDIDFGDVKSLTELFVRVLNTGADITLQSIENQSEFVVFRPQDGQFFLREGIIDQTPDDYLLEVKNKVFAMIPIANVDNGSYTVETSIVPIDSDIAHVALLDLSTNEVKHYTGFTQHKEETVDLELDFESLTSHFLDVIKSGTDITLQSNSEVLTFTYQNDLPFLRKINPDGTFTDYLLMQYDKTFGVISSNENGETKVETVIIPTDSSEADIAIYDVNTKELKHYFGYTGHRLEEPEEPTLEELGVLTNEFVDRLKSGENINLVSTENSEEVMMFTYQEENGGILLVKQNGSESKSYLLTSYENTLALSPLSDIIVDDNITVETFIVPIRSEEADIAFLDLGTKEIKHYNEHVAREEIEVDSLNEHFLEVLKSGTDITLQNANDDSEILLFTYHDGLPYMRRMSTDGSFTDYLLVSNGGAFGVLSSNEEGETKVETVIIINDSQVAHIDILDVNSKEVKHYFGYTGHKNEEEPEVIELEVAPLTKHFTDVMDRGEYIQLQNVHDQSQAVSFEKHDDKYFMRKGDVKTGISKDYHIVSDGIKFDVFASSDTPAETAIIPIDSDIIDIAILDLTTGEKTHYSGYTGHRKQEVPEVEEDAEVTTLTKHFLDTLSSGTDINLYESDNQNNLLMFTSIPNENDPSKRTPVLLKAQFNEDKTGYINEVQYMLIEHTDETDPSISVIALIGLSSGQVEDIIIPVDSTTSDVTIISMYSGETKQYMGYTGHKNIECEDCPPVEEECEDCKEDCVECVEDYTTPITKHLLETLVSGVNINLKEKDNPNNHMMFTAIPDLLGEGTITPALMKATFSEEIGDYINAENYILQEMNFGEDPTLLGIALFGMDLNMSGVIIPLNSQEADVAILDAFTKEVKHYVGYTGHRPTNCCTPTDDCEDGSCYENRCEICGRFNCDKGEDCVPYSCGICGEKGAGCYDGYCKTVDWNYSTAFSTAYGGGGGGDVYTCTKCGKNDGTCSPSQCGTYSCLFCEEDGCENGSICLGENFQGAMEFSKSGFNGLTPEITAQNPEIDTVTGKPTGRVYPIFADHWLQATGETQGGVEFSEMTKEEINAALRETDHRNTWPYHNEEGQYDKNLPYKILPEFDTTGRKTLEDGTKVETIGQLTEQAHDSGLGRINLFRKMMGAPGVYLDPGMSKSAQAGAFLLGKHGGKIQHGIGNPGMDQDLYSSGNQAIKNGLLASYPFPYSVDNWMQDPGQMWSKSDGTAYQASPGHRVYMTAPVAAKFGYGYTTVNDWDFSKVPADQLFSPQPHGVSSLKGCDCSGIKAGFEFVSWPAPGFCPLGPWPKTHKLMKEDWPRPIWTSPWSVHFLSLSTNFRVKLYKINKETDSPERAWIANFNGKAENMFGRLESGVIHEGVDSITGLTCEPFCAVVEEGPGSSYLNRVVSFYPMSEGHQYEDGDIYEVIIEYGGFRAGGEPMKRVKFRTEFFTPDFI